MSDEQAATFAAIAGVDIVTAATYMEMAGGNLDSALALFFDGFGGGPGPGKQQQENQSWAKFDGYGVIWPNADQPIPEAWLDQGFVFSKESGQRVGLLQPKNGPCGVLAVVNAVFIAECLANDVPGFGLNFEPTDNFLAASLSSIILKAKAGPGPCRVARWKGVIGEDIHLDDVGNDELVGHIEIHIDSFKGRGGIVLFLYSVIFTRGINQADIELDSSEPPLITGPNWLCTTDLVSLLLSGVAKGNVSAYNPLDGNKIDWPLTGVETLGIGLLSKTEVEVGVPITDALKHPKYPVYVLHGGDHFTVLFSLSGPTPTEAGSTFSMLHWNGLPPLGPRMTPLTIKASKGQRVAAPAKHKETFYKPEAGEIDVQPNPSDKKVRPKQWDSWSFEIVLAIDDPDVEGVPRPADVPPAPKFEQGPNLPGPWRCASCYRKRYQTYCFGQNDEGGPVCKYCGKTKEEAGWSIWMHYSQLPSNIQRLVTRRDAPAIVSILHTKWPSCEVTYEPKDQPPGC